MTRYLKLLFAICIYALNLIILSNSVYAEVLDPQFVKNLQQKNKDLKKNKNSFKRPAPLGSGFEYVTVLENGYEAVVLYGHCNLCYGKQVCTVCNGLGFITEYYPYTYNVICPGCQGYKYCPICYENNGYVAIAAYAYTPKGMITDFINFGVYDNNNSHSHTSSSSTSSCSKCNGSGVDPFPNEDQINFSTYNSKGLIVYQHLHNTSICPYCTKNNKIVEYHYHIKCLFCK